jgi:putative redox protein
LLLQAVDLVSILKKQRQNVDSVRIKVEGQRAPDMPRPFEKLHATFVVAGNGLDPVKVRHLMDCASFEGVLTNRVCIVNIKVERAVQLSVEKYCGVHATLEHGVGSITWGSEVVEGGK